MAYKGKFSPKNPQKYAGDVLNIIWRSTWERQVMDYLDLNENVIYWSSEELSIRYYNPIDNKIHRYFPDFVAKIKRKDGIISTYVLEIKPERQTKMPSQKRKTQKYLEESATYIINQSKWKAATEFCKDQGWHFKILTERDIGII
jgi:hypothetical protein